MWHALFGLTNLIAVAGWIVLAAFPRRPLINSAVLYLGVALLCLCYAAMFVSLFGGLVDAGRVPGAPPADLSDYSIPGIRTLFQSDGGIVLGWTHYLAFDLFVGLWIARDADAKGFSRLVQLPFLFATFMAGPIGLLAWLTMRERRAREGAPRKPIRL
ncbi:MAG: ABA4-like family protein [Novosphingobium sp.]